jgi:hypothetical protein
MSNEQVERKNLGLEERIAAQPAPKVTEASIKEHIVEVSYACPFASTPHFTICGIKMSNGFLVIGQSAPVSPENFNREIGQELAYKDAFNKLWALEGYALATELVHGTSADPSAYYANGENSSNES